MHVAKRKDGTPVRAGDLVVVQLQSGSRFVGRIQKTHTPMRFSDIGGLLLQTYWVSTRRGGVRPVRSFDIKTVLKSNVIPAEAGIHSNQTRKER